MEEQAVAIAENLSDAVEEIKKVSKKKTQNFKNHIAVRDETFKDFKEIKDEPGSDAFIKKLLKLYVANNEKQ